MFVILKGKIINHKFVFVISVFVFVFGLGCVCVFGPSMMGQGPTGRV